MPKKKKKPEMIYHHIIAEAQDGPNAPWNIYYWERDREKNWHTLFGTLLPSDCVALIKKWAGQDGDLNENRMTRREVELFEIIFGHVNCPRAIKFIEDNFLPAEQRFFREGADRHKHKS